MTRRVILLPHDLAWGEAFQQEAGRITAALRGLHTVIHHVGSTAIPGIHAKPIIDMLLLVEDLDELGARSATMEAFGYEVMGEYGIPGRRYFRKLTEEGVHTHHVHAFREGSDGAVRHLAFRDYMMAHPDAARAYSELKQHLAEEHPLDIDAYIDGKDPFIKEHEARALAWRQSVWRAD
ncbi:MAG: GrpB family protein [Anaerolineales bacterium]|nr:GrpB family protein [Anaerolineales bacterium]